MTPKLGFKVTIFLKVKYLENGTEAYLQRQNDRVYRIVQF